MRLRIQLLLMNVLSTSIMVLAIWYSETKMLLEPEQTRLLTIIAVVAFM
ncbi:sensor histidine kinase, partial [Brevibacillus sp. SIMBA_076]